MRRWSAARERRSAPRASTATLGALLSRRLRKSQRTEVDMPDATRSGALDFAGVGFAVPVRPSPLRALRSRARQASQDARRMGVAVAVAPQALVARARDRRVVADS